MTSSFNAVYFVRMIVHYNPPTRLITSFLSFLLLWTIERNNKSSIYSHLSRRGVVVRSWSRVLTLLFQQQHTKCNFMGQWVDE